MGAGGGLAAETLSARASLGAGFLGGRVSRGGTPGLSLSSALGELLPGYLHTAPALFCMLLGGLQPGGSASANSSLLLPPHAPRSAPKAWLQACPLLQETISPSNTDLAERHFHTAPTVGQGCPQGGQHGEMAGNQVASG